MKKDPATFRLWIEFGTDLATLSPELPITSPPYVDCKFWNPRRMFEVPGDTQTSGVRLCHAKEMYQDFSCFRDREATAEVAA
jgi:hypothetical protein